MRIDLEVLSTDGSDFKWKLLGGGDSSRFHDTSGFHEFEDPRWGAGHASYKFGDLLIRNLAAKSVTARSFLLHRVFAFQPNVRFFTVGDLVFWKFPRL